jgi:hypothetical protein
MNTLKVPVSNDVNMPGIPSVPVPSKPPIRVLPRGAKAKGELYGASFNISWKSILFSILFFALAVAAFTIFLYFV